MSDEKKCFGEQQGIRGCAACILAPAWLNFLRGKGLDENCRPKMVRQYGEEAVELLSNSKAQIDPGITDFGMRF